jgi:hypothetical protein
VTRVSAGFDPDFPGDCQMTPFFVPGLVDKVKSTQDAYTRMRKQVEVGMGRPPREQRILELWTRRGNLDCVTTVGEPDPICGELVMAIFDMGPHQPFLVCHQNDAHPVEISYAVLGDSAYAVSEFDA